MKKVNLTCDLKDEYSFKNQKSSQKIFIQKNNTEQKNLLLRKSGDSDISNEEKSIATQPTNDVSSSTSEEDIKNFLKNISVESIIK